MKNGWDLKVPASEAELKKQFGNQNSNDSKIQNTNSSNSQNKQININKENKYSFDNELLPETIYKDYLQIYHEHRGKQYIPRK